MKRNVTSAILALLCAFVLLFFLRCGDGYRHVG